MCSASLPKNSIQKLGENVSCVKPEFLLIQLSPLLPYPQLALIALEMCGTYAIDPSTRNFIGNLMPATTSKKVKEYINEYEKLNPHFKGKRKIKSIVNFLGEKSASPMESRLYIKLCGDRKEGFYGCRNLIMNQPVRLSEEACKIAGQPVVYPDLINLKHKVAIEYNSAQYHETNEQGQKDRRRRDALVYDGWKVISITPQQFYNNSTFHIIALQILDLLGQSFNLNMAKFSKKRDTAFKLLD